MQPGWKSPFNLSIFKKHLQTRCSTIFAQRIIQEPPQIPVWYVIPQSKEKEHIYTYVERHGFPSFRGKESQDVCFLKNTRVASFLEDHGGYHSRPGAIVNTSGDILGSHQGIFNYTVGQRKGLGISAPEPYYVIRLDSEHNIVVVGNNNELDQRIVTLTNLHWISGVPPRLPARYLVKIRYTHKGDMATLTQEKNNTFMLYFESPQRAVTPGQFAVFYHNDMVIGAGEITAKSNCIA